jgi:Abortive infection alpha
MAQDDESSGLSVDIAAKASLELKAEIPKESMGRALDALVDIIRPFTEARGLRADQIRLQRAEVAYEIAKIAKAAAELEKLELKPPPTKFLVPFLEHASLEDQDKELHSRWASLLLSASTHYEARHLTFIDLLSRLSSHELLLLEEVCLTDKSFPELCYPDGHVEQNERRAEKIAYMFNMPESNSQNINDVFAKILLDHDLAYGRIMHVSLGGLADLRVLYSEYGGFLQPKYPSLEILERERLVEFHRTRPSGAAAEVAYFSISYLGVDFVRDCSPNARESIKRHKQKAIRVT